MGSLFGKESYLYTTFVRPDGNSLMPIQLCLYVVKDVLFYYAITKCELFTKWEACYCFLFHIQYSSDYLWVAQHRLSMIRISLWELIYSRLSHIKLRWIGKLYYPTSKSYQEQLGAHEQRSHLSAPYGPYSTEISYIESLSFLSKIF